ncbi:hypothetical protein [Pectobacterium parmentieri]|uniref:hypothetical protein n=1 Tax=Pectobacterium parmentieri TaxID=1905730 RepID=UPI000F8D25CF|nr:hypothetical protein [Pectobacterium parmentieri]MBI0431716.1 hypothetical protein [Pectobacterium parmentieri]
MTLHKGVQPACTGARRSGRQACFPAHGRNAATFFAPDGRPAFSPDTVGRTDGATSWGELLTKEAS